ncbi:MAG: WecB/TagA/CpsF family glycosyltransferase [Pseudomonadota bacterium]
MTDLTRQVRCVFGLPVDIVDFASTIDRVHKATRDHRLFLSTPNLNFIVQCQQDPEFLASLVDSDLVILDGMIPVWIARVMGLGPIEKISGSNLFETLMAMEKTTPLRVFLFGGEEGVAEKAAIALNNNVKGVECVGYHSPGFVPIEQMSTAEVVDKINASDAEFLLVALGAKKGQAWIQRNRQALNTPVISHLGAVINHTAGDIKRAPFWLQSIGLEWMWRIIEEPKLWRRYLSDGLRMLGITAAFVYRRVAISWSRRSMRHLPSSFSFDAATDGGRVSVSLRGDAEEYRGAGLVDALQRLIDMPALERVVVNLEDLDELGPNFLGFLILLTGAVRKRGASLEIVGASAYLRRVIRLHSADYLLTPALLQSG